MSILLKASQKVSEQAEISTENKHHSPTAPNQDRKHHCSSNKTKETRGSFHNFFLNLLNQ